MQIIGEKRRHRYSEGLRQDNPLIRLKGRQACGHRRLHLSLVDSKQGTTDILRLKSRLVDDEENVRCPVGTHVKGLHYAACKKAEHRRQKIGQAVIHNKNLHNRRHGPHEGNKHGQHSIDIFIAAQTDDSDNRA